MHTVAVEPAGSSSFTTDDLLRERVLSGDRPTHSPE
jgi:hypothetical protein